MEEDPHIPGVLTEPGGGIGETARVVERIDQACGASTGLFAAQNAGQWVGMPG